MEKSKRKIHAVLLTAVLMAVFVGILYYYYNVKGGADMTEGTLIAGLKHNLAQVAAYVRR